MKDALRMLKNNILKPKFAKYLFFTITYLKIASFYFVNNLSAKLLGVPEDANVYHNIATGVFYWPHPWGIFLKILNDYGLYSRPKITIIIFLISCAMVPWLIGKIISVKNSINALGWYLLSMVALYPSLIVFSLDIYRDVILVVFFLVFIYGVRYFIGNLRDEWRWVDGSWSLMLVVISGCIIYLLRNYLIFALIAALVLTYVLDKPIRFGSYLIYYFIGLILANFIGVFDYLKIEYRQGFSGAGSGYQLDFSQGLFLFNYIKSFAYNIVGLYIYSPLSLAVFILESIPIMALSVGIYTFRSCGDRYSNFLVFFFFIYGALWSVGTDALGTAVRYRIFNYLAIILVAGLMAQNHVVSENIEDKKYKGCK